jgi:hypothetical protein
MILTFKVEETLTLACHPRESGYPEAVLFKIQSGFLLVQE